MLNRKMCEALEREIGNYIDILHKEREIKDLLLYQNEKLREENEMLRLKIEMLTDEDKADEDK